MNLDQAAVKAITLAEAKRSNQSKRVALSLLIGTLISGAALYFALKNVPLNRLANYFASFNYLWLVPSVLLVVSCFVLRALRWQVILGSTRQIGFWRAYHPMMIGFLINCVLPGRVGEVARPIILQRREAVPFPTGLATVAAERVFDLGMLVTLFIAFYSVVRIDPHLSIPFGNYQLNHHTLTVILDGMLKLGLLLIAGIFLVSATRTRSLIIRLILALPAVFFFTGRRFQEKLRQRICQPVVRLVENVALGFALIRYPKKIAICILITAAIWFLHAVSYYTVALGSPGMQLSFAQISTMMIIICFFIALPSVPGYWGLWEAGGVFALALFGIPARDAAGFTLANHAVQMFPVMLMGLASVMATSINIWQLSYDREVLGK
jgi:uncharacterized protein (TIRG00374 family)